MDREPDRLHPYKKTRPVAAGAVSPKTALFAAVILAAAALVFGSLLSALLAAVILAYIGLQLAYTCFLKRFAMIDVLVIAAGFVLRAIAGAVVIEVSITAWLLVCAYLLAVFLALCKRRQEYVGLESAGLSPVTRTNLIHYNERLLDQLISIAAAATLVCYAIYTLAPETVQKYGTHRLGFTLPFVLFGLFRYLFLVYRRDLGERPEQVLLTDPPTLVNLALYGAAVLLIIL